MLSCMNRRVYLDHAAATPLDPKVRRCMERYIAVEFANPSAIHEEGVRARNAVEEARRGVAHELGVLPDEIVFTSGATESANLALIGTVDAWRKAHPGRIPHVIVSSIEHDAVLAPARVLEARGVRVTRLPIDRNGFIDCGHIKTELSLDTVVISVMLANNEIGTIQPLREIAKIIRKWRKEHRGVARDRKRETEERYPLFHTDATQAVNYCDVNIPRMGVDMLTMNAAKIYGPKGVGVLAVLRNTPIEPILFGGGQEAGRRSGTENVPAIVGFREALRLACMMRAKEAARLTKLRDRAIARLSTIPDLVVNGDPSARLPNNINFSIKGIDHEFLALQLDAKGFAVATKSACNESDAETSHVLSALRRAQGNSAPQSGIRITLGRGTTAAQVNRFVAAVFDIANK